MPITIAGGGASGGGGASTWSELTGKPAIQTTIGDPGSDANLVSEQAAREALNPFKFGGIGAYFAEPSNVEYIITDACPIGGTITGAAFKTRSGTVEATFRINGVAITGLTSLAASSTRATATATAARTVAAEDVISVLFVNGATPVDFTATLDFTRA